MARARGKHKKVLFWIGQTASFLCLIHCLATVALTFVAPQLLRMLPHNYWIEGGAWTFVLVSSLFLLSRAPKRQWHYWVLSVIVATGTTALVIHNHNIFATAFMSLALFQLYLTLAHHWFEHTGDDQCCTHPEHDHAHPLAHAHSHSHAKAERK